MARSFKILAKGRNIHPHRLIEGFARRKSFLEEIFDIGSGLFSPFGSLTLELHLLVMVTLHELVLAQSSLRIACMVLSGAADLILIILAGLLQYSHLSLESVQPNGLISKIATSCVSNLFRLTSIATRGLHFQTTNMVRAYIERHLELGGLGPNDIQICNQLDSRASKGF